MILKRMLLGVLCVISLFSVSCGEKQIHAETLLEELREVSGEMPEGSLYLSGAEEGSDTYFSPSLRNAMYGEDAEELFSLLEEYAVYLSSFASPCEIAVFRSASVSDAERITAMCMGRADTVRVLLRQTEFRDMTDSIRVICQGKYVIMGLIPEPEAFERQALRLIR